MRMISCSKLPCINMSSRRACTVLLAQLANAARAPTAARATGSRVLGTMLSQAMPFTAASVSWGSCQLGFAARCLSTSRSSMNTLAQVLEEELKVEKEEYVKPEEIASGPPAPFTLTESPDDTLLTLKRTYNGEEVAVDLHVNNQPGQDYGDENTNDADETLSTVTFNVTVTKNNSALVFECESDGTYVSISHLSHEPKDGHPSESFYTGPVFAELDETLQLELRKYLQDRGITEELGEYLRHLVYDKEQQEYMSWLQKVKDFVK